MRVLLIDAYEATDPRASIAAITDSVLQANGCDVEHLRIHDLGFTSFMTEAELRAFRTADPLVTPETRSSGEAVRRADALVLCFPATVFEVPAVLKSWYERVLVPGVGFRMDERRRVRPGMTHIRRLGAVATTPHDTRAVLRARNPARRTIMRTMWMNCGPRCRRTYVSVREPSADVTASRRIESAFRRWN